MKTILKIIYYQKFTILSIVLSVVFSYLFYPLMNADSMNALVSIYSILAGFLIGVISLLGDPMLIPSSSWKSAQGNAHNTARSLSSTKILLYIYLLTLLLIFLHKIVFSYDGTLPEDMYFKEPMEVFLSKIAMFKDSVDRFILFFALLAFLFSFKLPSKLYEIQTLRMNHEIDARRRAENIQD